MALLQEDGFDPLLLHEEKDSILILIAVALMRHRTLEELEAYIDASGRGAGAFKTKKQFLRLTDHILQDYDRLSARLEHLKREIERHADFASTNPTTSQPPVSATRRVARTQLMLPGRDRSAIAVINRWALSAVGQVGESRMPRPVQRPFSC